MLQSNSKQSILPVHTEKVECSSNLTIFCKLQLLVKKTWLQLKYSSWIYFNNPLDIASTTKIVKMFCLSDCLSGCLDMVAVEGQFTFTAESLQLSCAAFFMADPSEVIGVDLDRVDIDCSVGDFVTVREDTDPPAFSLTSHKNMIILWLQQVLQRMTFCH